jgi:protein SCO1/2
MTRLVIAALLAAAHAAHAQPAPRAVVESGVTERIGAQVPLAVPFTEARRGPTRLGQVLDGKRPVLLVLAYARCTMLCSLVLRGVASVAHRMTLAPGRDYQLIVISLDPRETVDEAARKQSALLAELGGAAAPARGPYLVGTRPSIDAVAGAIGFRYAWDPRTEQYAHPAVMFVLTPDARVARTLHGIEFDPDEVSAALADATAGRMVTKAAADVMRCFRFDPASRRAGARAQRFLQIGAASIFVMLVAGIGVLIAWERRIRRQR